MPIYAGRVQGNSIILPEGVELPEGQAVEIHVPDKASILPEQIDPEEPFLQRLLDIGLISEIRRPLRDPVSGDRTPSVIRGQPLSEQVIEERR